MSYNLHGFTDMSLLTFKIVLGRYRFSIPPIPEVGNQYWESVDKVNTDTTESSIGKSMSESGINSGIGNTVDPGIDYIIKNWESIGFFMNKDALI